MMHRRTVLRALLGSAIAASAAPLAAEAQQPGKVARVRVLSPAAPPPTLFGRVYKILRGTKASDLPVEQAARYDVTINLKTANALGLTIPPSLLLRADQVIK